MILILTSKDDATADYVVKRLRQSDYLRLDSDTIPEQVSIDSTEYESFLVIGRKRFSPSDFTGVWYRRPKALAFSGGHDRAESKHAAEEYTAALEGFLSLIPIAKWVNHPTCNVLAGHKLEQIRLAQQIGFRVPKTLITQDPDRLRTFWSDCRANVIVKPLSCGYIERTPPAEDSLIYTNSLRIEDLTRTVEIQRCPTLFQERIRKIADIRVTVIDGNIQAVDMTASDNGEQRLDIRRDNMADVQYSAVTLPKEIHSKINRMLRRYRLRFAAIDLLRHSDSGYVFLEINPNGQWAWLDMSGVTNSRDHLIAALQKQ